MEQAEIKALALLPNLPGDPHSSLGGVKGHLGCLGAHILSSHTDLPASPEIDQLVCQSGLLLSLFPSCILLVPMYHSRLISSGTPPRGLP